MSNADAARAEVARHAARTRWVERQGNPVLRRAVGVVVERQAELAPDLLAELRAVTSDQDGDDQDG